MKNFIITLVLLFAAGCSSTPYNRDYNVNKRVKIKRKVNIEGFENNSKYSLNRYAYSLDKLIKNEVEQTNRFEVLGGERQKTNEVLFSNLDINKKLSKGSSSDEAEFSISGVVSHVGLEKEDSLLNERQKTYIELYLKLVDLETGKIYSFPGEITVEVKHSKAFLDNFKGEYKGEIYEEDIYQGIKLASISAMNKLIVKLDDIPWSIQGVLENGEVFIPYGKASNLRVGNRLQVYRKTKPLFIEDKFIGSSEEKIGTVRIEEYISDGNVSRCVFTGDISAMDGMVYLKE